MSLSIAVSTARSARRYRKGIEDQAPRAIWRNVAYETGAGQKESQNQLVDAISVVRNQNIEPTAVLWAGRTQQTHDKFKTSIGSYAEPPSSVAEIPRLVTNQIPTNLHVGSSTDCSEIYVGRWSDLLVGIRTDMRVQVRALTERYIDNLQYGLLCYLRADVQLAHPEALNVVTGVRP